MNQLQKYTWLIDTIRRAGKISHEELSNRWMRNINYSDGKPLPRATFNRWRDAILSQFNIIIECQRVGGYLYYIANPEDIDDDKLKKWMLDSFATGYAIGENLSVKDRVLVEEIPSGREFLTTIMEAMKENRVLEITYHSFNRPQGNTFKVEPYCVKLFENRWYLLARAPYFDDMRIYGLDRIKAAKPADETFKFPKDFSAADFFATYYGIVVDRKAEPTRIVLRATGNHKHYLNSLPLHHSQRMIEDCGEYADFELHLAPTYDFIMKLLHDGEKIEVISPPELRYEMELRISKMYSLYKK